MLECSGGVCIGEGKVERGGWGRGEEAMSALYRKWCVYRTFHFNGGVERAKRRQQRQQRQRRQLGSVGSVGSVGSAGSVGSVSSVGNR